jgi:glycosyltransferase involved in cell wall biosynthesis
MVESKGVAVRVGTLSSAEPPCRDPRPSTSYRLPASSDPGIPRRSGFEQHRTSTDELKIRDRGTEDNRRDLRRRDEEIARLNSLVASLRRTITEILASTSWRVTAPLRGLRPAAQLAYWLVTLQIFARLREHRQVRRIRDSGAFDADFYAAEYPDTVASIDPVQHYLLFGAAEGRDPSPAFDSAAYVAEHPEAAGAGRNPLIHYLETRRPTGPPPWRPDWNSIKPAMPALEAALRAALYAAAQARDEIEPAPPVFPATPDPRVSIIVMAGRDPPRLARCLYALGRNLNGLAAEIFVVGISNPRIEVMSEAAGVMFLNAGATRQAAWPALGARSAKGHYLVFLSDDIVVLPGAVEALVETFDRFPRVGAVGVYRIHANGLCATAGGIIQRGGNLGARSEVAPLGHHDYASVQEVDFCPLDALAVPAATWHRVAGFDETFDTADYRAADFAMRLRAIGCSILCQPFSRVVSTGPSQEEDIARIRDDQATFLARWRIPGSGQRGGTSLQARPRALFIDQLTPAPDRDAGSGLVQGFMRILQALGYEVTFIGSDTLDHAGRYTDDLRTSGIICICAPFVNSLGSFLEREAAGFDLVVLWRQTIANECLDLVRLSAPAAKIVFHTVDLHFLREERHAQLTGSKRMMAQARRTRVAELVSIRDADCTVLVSRHESDVIGALLPEARTRVIPLVLDIPGRLAPAHGRQDVVFIGGFRHQPNVDAVLFLTAEVWPLVRRALPSARLLIIGGEAPAEIEALDDSDKGIRILGWVEDLTETLRSCRLTVAPLRFGAGVKGKIVTSLAYGVPCVATSVAIEGMALEGGRHILVAERPADMAAIIVELYGNAALWESLSDAGLDFARRNFSIESVSAQIKEMLQDLGLPADVAESQPSWPAVIPPAIAPRQEGRASGPASEGQRGAPALPAPATRVSVVVPLYNHERYIGRALQSVLSQTEPAHEIIVVDDGSTDSSAARVEHLAARHPEIVFWSKENGGAHSAINAGIGRATGDLVAILNSDDIYHPERLAVMRREFESLPPLDAVATRLDFIDGDGRAIRNSWYEDGVAFHRRTQDLALTLVNGNIFMTTSNLVARRTLFDEVGGLSALRYAHDLDFFLRLIAKGKKIRVIDQPLLSYRQHPTNTIKEDTLKVKAEWAAATAFFLNSIWDPADRHSTDWDRANDFITILNRHSLTAPVLLCMAYFRQHPSKSLEDSPFHDDDAFRVRLAELLR